LIGEIFLVYFVNAAKTKSGIGVWATLKDFYDWIVFFEFISFVEGFEF